MSLVVNLRHLEAHPLELKGELPVAELDLDLRDEMIRAQQPLRYALEVQKVEDGLLLQGHLHLTLQCQCVRCLKPFEYQVDLSAWKHHCALAGEDKLPVVNNCVDLTPRVREDILLEFPQHPLCETNCGGLPQTDVGRTEKNSGGARTKRESSAWAALDKLKL
jgi:uncharacterized metal-binding protein YceD (DUF177 family)